jgi:NAD(P)-dependent dehydrogenase (short-subunit alcohol dehydrogenase family)
MLDLSVIVPTAVLVALSGVFDNHLWRIILLVARHHIVGTPSSLAAWALFLFAFICIWWMPHYANNKSRPKMGCIFVTGCDSGMGKATVIGLAKAQTGDASDAYDQIFAGCYDPKTTLPAYEKELSEEEMKSITLVPLDVTDNESVQKAAKAVEGKRLTALVQFHGIAFNGPSAYMPIDMYTRQLDVNFVGTIRVVQALLPLLKQSAKSGDSYNSRIVLTGTGGGSCSPCPPLLTAYMSSKFALEAYAQSLRQELSMTDARIDVGVINPGFVKPTMLISEGTRISAKMWVACESKLGSPVAKDEFGAMLDHFTEYSALQPGTHVSEIVKATEHALLAPVPRSSYKVGIDSKMAPIVGMLPTGARELITRHGIYGKLSPAGTVAGYKV